MSTRKEREQNEAKRRLLEDYGVQQGFKNILTAIRVENMQTAIKIKY